ncbi:hypothetical protein [Burkholderia sp. RS02]|uniref:hypothetical protein n=1 Tax=unclassified Burkholderia TaxID=2613784 RepID=UPI00321822CB
MIDPKADRYKKELLYRRVRGKTILNEYLRKVAALFSVGAQKEIIPLDKTDAILEKFKDGSARLRTRKRRISLRGVGVALSKIKKSNLDSFYVLIDDDWKYCGALLVKNMGSIDISLRFGEVVLNDLLFISDDLSKAMSLDFFEMDGISLVDVTEWRR